MNMPKRLKISCVIMTVGIIIGIAISVVDLVVPLFAQNAFEGYVGEPWDKLTENRPQYGALYEHLSRASDFYWLTISIFTLLTIFFAYAKGEKWAWVALLITGILANGTNLFFGLVFSDNAGAALGMIGVCVTLFALLLPAKDIWTANH